MTRSAKLLEPLLKDPRAHVYICGSTGMASEASWEGQRGAPGTHGRQQKRAGRASRPPAHLHATPPFRHPPPAPPDAQVNAALAKVAGKDVMERMALEGRQHEDVFGVSVANRAEAAKVAQGQNAVKELAGADLATVLARLDAGLPINSGACVCLREDACICRAVLVGLLVGPEGWLS